MPLSDFPKVFCPFVRVTYPVDKQQWKERGNLFNMRAPNVRLVIPQVNPGFEWVFEDPDTIATEKLHGTNVKIRTENGRLVELANRLNQIDPLQMQILKGKAFIIEAIFQSIAKGYVQDNMEQAGEVVGPKVNANPYELVSHEWYPFSKAVNDLQYRSFKEHAPTYENLSSWFKDYLFSRYYQKKHKDSDKKIFAEGVVFWNLKRKAQEQSYMAKLRRDMFAWYYEGFDIDFDHPIPDSNSAEDDT